MSIEKHIIEHEALGIDANAVQTIFEPDFQVFIPLDERYGNTSMCPITGIVQELSTLGLSAWVTSPEGRLPPGAGAGEHLNIEELLSGEIPILADTQGLIMTSVFTTTGVGSLDTPS